MTGQDGTPTGERLAPVFQYCHWCRGFASDVRPVAASDAGSGPRQQSYSACPSHRAQHGLTPLGEQ
ncbi:hypothetical protein ACGFY9_13795 [Streptomyces sp. NPDC048504]|uniref:hypothetical protein n=1 Tax=Streptomyces sp. NPDC048504 TaxID=3365559 RepID=UPI0037173632